MPGGDYCRLLGTRNLRPSSAFRTVDAAALNARTVDERAPAIPAPHVTLEDLRHIYTFLFFGLYSSFPAGVTTASAFRCASMIWRCTWGGWNIIGAQGAASYITRT